MSLTEAQIQQFNDDGYLLIEGGLNDADLDPVIEEYAAHIDGRARELLAAGEISQIHEDAPFERRLALLCGEYNDLYRGLDIMQFRGRACFEFLRNGRLLDMVERIVGPEIICSPIQHIRPKLPEGLTPGGTDAHVVPWHQDAGVTWEEADPYFILTVWLPFCDATPENGCLQIVPRVHGQGLLQHHPKPGEGTTIVASVMPEGEVLTLPMRKGDVLFMHKEIPHRSTPNESDTVRWSADLRYQETGTPTGRPFYPDFVARSRVNPESEVTDHAEWDQLWAEALAQKPPISPHRWQKLETAG